MELQSVCCGFIAPKLRLSAYHPFCHQIVSVKLGSTTKACLKPSFGSAFKGFSLTSLKRGVIIHASSSNSSTNTNLNLMGKEDSGVPAASFHGLEAFRGKSGSVSFCGLTYQSVEEGKLVSAPFNEDKGSLLWVLGPVALIASLIVPQFFLANAIEAFLKDEVLVEIVASLSFEAMFYIGLTIFLAVTDRIQRPYLQFSSKRWGLITGLRGYLTSAFFAMGLKVLAPLLVVYATWPALGLPALVSVFPFLVGCLAQRVFEIRLDQRGSSCWPLVPIIFEVYRIYQLTKAAHFVEKLMFSMRGLPESAQLLDRNNALIVMIVTFQFLGVVSLWSLLTFILRLFPSRPVAENY
ncbi:hypothetical protein JCGZ_04369 [Jatropha curcas]|uniref:Uncharacterized protein n=1 Tax=Jatropha curcas TaxID=180498 RepID=A0A067L2W0_JATCU|nr:uncharacterized protein LOC105633723 [Jatropha curcas]KDP38444.1 hypothetical protein JCGZ_04369 [Jatropha curcas]